MLSALSAGRPADNADVADELSLTPSVNAASDGEKRALDALQAGEHSALDAELMLVRTDAIVCVQPPPWGTSLGGIPWKPRGSVPFACEKFVKDEALILMIVSDIR